MNRSLTVLALLLSLGAPALAQQTVIQGGPVTFGHAPMYIAAPGGRAMIGDAGGAAGGPIGTGLAELGLTARGVGNPPFIGQGSGPFGANACDYDAPTNNATGYHFLCWSPDLSISTNRGGYLIYGAGGGATTLPLYIDINGTVVNLASLGVASIAPGTTIISPKTNGGVLYDNNGVLGDSTTLPSGLAIPSPTLTNPVIGAGAAITSSGPGGALAAPAFSPFGTGSGDVAEGGVIVAGGPIGSATVVPVITWNAGGQLTVVTTASLGTAAADNTGTAGATIPLNNGGFTQSGTVNFTGIFEIGGNAINTSGGVPNIDGSMTTGHCLEWGPGVEDAGASCATTSNALRTAANNTALEALASTIATEVERLGYATQGDAPPQVYQSSSSACSLNSGSGDGGSQVPSSDSKCWLAVWPAVGADIREFGAVDLTGGTDETTPFQNAINAMAGTGSAINCPAGKFKINTPLNATNLVGLSINGPVGQWPGNGLVNAAPTAGCVILGNTNGKEVFDAIGSTAVHWNNLAISSIGQSTPSKYGILCGSSTGIQTGSPGGTDCSGTNVAITMATGSGSIPFNHNNGGGADVWNNLTVSGDYGITLTSTNPLSITPTYSAYDATSLGGTDAVRCYGCNALSPTGADYALYIEGSNDIHFDRFYTAMISGAGSGYSASQFPIYVKNAQDIDIDIESDYWPSVLVTYGTIDSLRMRGVSYPYTTALGTNQPNYALFNGTSITNSHFDIQGVGSAPSGTHFLYISGVTISSIYGDTFTYNTAFNSDVCYCNSATGSVFFNLRFDGNTDSATLDFYVNTVGATASQYRYFLNGNKVGTL